MRVMKSHSFSFFSQLFLFHYLQRIMSSYDESVDDITCLICDKMVN